MIDDAGRQPTIGFAELRARFGISERQLRRLYTTGVLAERGIVPIVPSSRNVRFSTAGVEEAISRFSTAAVEQAIANAARRTER